MWTTRFRCVKVGCICWIQFDYFEMVKREWKKEEGKKRKREKVKKKKREGEKIKIFLIGDDVFF